LLAARHNPIGLKPQTEMTFGDLSESASEMPEEEKFKKEERPKYISTLKP
jgi:hypothetical protein